MKYYLGVFLLAFAVTAGSLAVVGYRIDPYNYFHFATSDTETLSRIDQLSYLRFTKPHYVEILRPQSIVLGTSRSATLPPALNGLQDNTAYNLSIPGLSQYEALRFLQHTHAQGKLERVVLGLDFESFIPPSIPTQSAIYEKSFLTRATDRWRPSYLLQEWRDIHAAIFSLDSLSQALQITRNETESGRLYSRDGTWLALPNIMLGKRGFAFIAKAAEDTHGKANTNTALHMETFKQLLEYAHRKKLDVSLLLTPVHLYYLERMFSLGYGAIWQNWHRELLTLNTEVARQFQRPAFPIWVFNHLDGVVNEAILPANKSQQTWFRDGVHFRRKMGQKMMDNVLGKTNSPAFGVLLNESTVENYIQEVEVLLGTYRASP